MRSELAAAYPALTMTEAPAACTTNAKLKCHPSAPPGAVGQTAKGHDRCAEAGANPDPGVIPTRPWWWGRGALCGWASGGWRHRRGRHYHRRVESVLLLGRCAPGRRTRWATSHGCMVAVRWPDWRTGMGWSWRGLASHGTRLSRMLC